MEIGRKYFIEYVSEYSQWPHFTTSETVKFLGEKGPLLEVLPEHETRSKWINVSLIKQIREVVL